jgi:hypothetical protein
LGIQEIVEVLRSPGAVSSTDGSDGTVDPSTGGAPSKLSVSANAGMRAYRTTNVMRVGSGVQGAGVMEFSLGANLATPSFPVFGKQIEPSLTLMSQRAYYGQFTLADDDVEKDTVKNFMDYEFRMINFAAATQLTEKWRATGAFEYDELRSFRSEQKMYHAFSPILSISRMEALTETSMLAFDFNLRYAFTEQVLPYSIDGVFEDDGDNWQTGINLTYVKAFGPEGRFMVLPSFGVTRTHYVKNAPAGRVDYLWTTGVSAMYSLTEHFALQAFLTYGNKSANAKGMSLLGASGEYENLDMGIGLTGQYAF